MTVSAHTHSAVLVGTPDVTLDVRGGRITLDEASAPHVSASLEVAVPSEATLASLDPRLGKRIRITAAANFPTEQQTRMFDLVLTDRSMRHLDGVVTLDLASDEILLAGYASTYDDDKLLGSAPSLRSLINEVLDDVIPGAQLEAFPAVDADMTPYWAITNLVTNSSFEFDIAGWSNGSLASGLALTSTKAFAGTKSGHWQTTGAGWSFINSDRMSVTAGREYIASTQLSQIGGVDRPGLILVRWFDARGTALRDDYSYQVTVPTSGWVRAANGLEAPPGATQASVHIGYQADAAGRFPAADGVMFYQDRIGVPFFDGHTPDDANYSYTYSDDAAQNGTSTRTPVLERDPDSLYWKTGQSALELLAPLVQAAGFRLVCDEQRRWTLRDEHYVAPGTLSLRHGVNLIDAEDTISRTSAEWFDAAVTVYTWTDRNGFTQTRRDVYAPSGFTSLRRFDKTTPYPGPGFSEYAVRRAQGRGREVTATSVSNWTARAEQSVSAVLAGAPAQVGRAASIEFDLNTDRMTVRTRTTDTVPGAIDLLAGTINSLSGTIDNL